jgi:hypothetical protein
MEIKDQIYWTTHCASIVPNKNFIREIIDNGIDINQTSDSVSPFVICISQCIPFDLLETFIDTGCDMRVDEDAPLCMAVITGNLQLTRKLLDMGANVNATLSSKLLKYATQQCRQPHCKFINSYEWDFGSDRNRCQSDSNFWTGFLCYASILSGSTDNYAMFNLLMEYNVNLFDRYGDTILCTFLLHENLSRDLFIEKIRVLLINNQLKSSDIGYMIYQTLLYHSTRKDIMDLFKEYTNEDVIDSIMSNMIRSLDNSYVNMDILIPLDYCIENFNCDKYFAQLDSIPTNKIFSYSRHLGKLLNLLSKIKIDIKKIALEYLIVAVYENDNDLLRTICQHVPLDELLAQLNDSVKNRLANYDSEWI